MTCSNLRVTTGRKDMNRNRKFIRNSASRMILLDAIMVDEMKYNRIPGAVVSMVRYGQLIFAKGYGYSDYENNTTSF